MANEIKLKTKLLVRRDISTKLNPYVLDEGEFGYSTDSKLIKMGDGSTPFSSLKTIAYADDITTAINAAIAALDVNATGAAKSKTLTAVSEQNGIFTFTFDDIAIEQDQVNGLTSALNGKIDKVSGTSGNLVMLDGNGNLSDTSIRYDDISLTGHEHAVSAIQFTESQSKALNSGITNDDVARLANVEAGAEVNIIETVKVNGTALIPDSSRAVDVVIPEAAEYSIEKLATATAGASASYQLTKDGTKVGAVIDIPKDMVVSSGAVVTDPDGQPAGTYIELTLANATSDKLYINVGNLIEYVTSGSAAGDMVVISVDETTHKVTAAITNGTITLEKLDISLQNAIAEHHVHSNLMELDKIADGDKQKWDIAAGKAHEHANKTLLDSYDQTNADIKDAVDKKHTHSFLDADVNDAIQKKHEHENKDVLDGIDADTVSSWNSRIINVTNSDSSIYCSPTDSSETEIEINVCRSEDTGNILTLKDDGLYVGVQAGTGANGNKDIVVTTSDGSATIAHKDYSTGTVKVNDGTAPEIPYFFNALSIENGHVTGATAQSLADALQSLSLVLDGGNAQQ